MHQKRLVVPKLQKKIQQEDAEGRRFAAAKQGANLEGYRNVARKYPKQSKQTQELYSAIAATHTSYQFLEAP